MSWLTSLNCYFPFWKNCWAELMNSSSPKKEIDIGRLSKLWHKSGNVFLCTNFVKLRIYNKCVKFDSIVSFLKHQDSWYNWVPSNRNMDCPNSHFFFFPQSLICNWLKNWNWSKFPDNLNQIIQFSLKGPKSCFWTHPAWRSWICLTMIWNSCLGTASPI